MKPAQPPVLCIQEVCEGKQINGKICYSNWRYVGEKGIQSVMRMRWSVENE